VNEQETDEKETKPQRDAHTHSNVCSCGFRIEMIDLSQAFSSFPSFSSPMKEKKRQGQTRGK